jgi:hypothetical protein
MPMMVAAAVWLAGPYPPLCSIFWAAADRLFYLSLLLYGWADGPGWLARYFAMACTTSPFLADVAATVAPPEETETVWKETAGSQHQKRPCPPQSNLAAPLPPAGPYQPPLSMPQQNSVASPLPPNRPHVAAAVCPTSACWKAAAALACPKPKLNAKSNHRANAGRLWHSGPGDADTARPQRHPVWRGAGLPGAHRRRWRGAAQKDSHRPDCRLAKRFGPGPGRDPAAHSGPRSRRGRGGRGSAQRRHQHGAAAPHYRIGEFAVCKARWPWVWGET